VLSKKLDLLDPEEPLSVGTRGCKLLKTREKPRVMSGDKGSTPTMLRANRAQGAGF
jgi:hypothetical protein